MSGALDDLSNEDTNIFSDDVPISELSAMILEKAKISTKHIKNVNVLYEGDCLEIMDQLEPESIDCIINDPPYGCTSNPWDKVIDLQDMWKSYLRVLKPNGTVILFACSDTTADPILPQLMISRPKGWKFYTLVFQKANISIPFHAKDRPNRIHEDIIVFYRTAQHTYNPQLVPRKNWGAKLGKNVNGKAETLLKPTSILPVFPREKTDNATSKPVGTMEWLVKTFTDEYDTVLDNTMGSGTTGVACANTHRDFVGIELMPEMYKYAYHRIDKAYKRTLREDLEEEEDTTETMTIELPERRPKFDVNDYTEFYEKVSQLPDYDLMVSWLVKYINQYFCIVVEGNSIIEFVYGEVEQQRMEISCTPMMEEEKEKIKWALSFTTRKAADLKLRFRRCDFHNENGKKADLYDVWSRSKGAREYEKQVFDPTRGITHDDSNVLNTFAGLKAEQEIVFDQQNTSMSVDVEEISIILYHIKNLCGGNNFYYEYLLDWLAYPIQTGEKTNVAVISQGPQGCGKSNFFVDFIGEQIYGQHLHAKIAGGKQIGGDFNAHISGNMFLAVEEPNDFSKAKLNILKDLITSGTVEINAKNKDQIFQDDYTNYVFTCNSIPDDMLEEDDRRYFIIQHNGERVGDTYFYKELSFCMETHVHEFYKFLKTRDIKHFVYGEKPPQTEIKKRLLTLKIDPVFRYLQHLAESEAVENLYKRPSDQRPILPFKAFFDNAVAWCDENCEEISWKKKPLIFKDILQKKLGDKEARFEPTQVKIPDFATGGLGLKNERCVLFPKSSDALMDMLINSRVYTDFSLDTDDASEEIPAYEDEFGNLDMQLKQAEMVELDAMIKREQQLKNRDKFDEE